jgi:signal peptidase I/rRNA maturation protein Nop10
VVASPPSTPAKEPGAGNPPEGRATRRDNLEAVVVAFILALLIRHYAMEAFVIPTGSMATTLLGAHADVTCANCGLEQPVSDALLRRAEDGDAALYTEQCSACGARVVHRAPPGSASRSTLEAACPGCGRRLVLSRPESMAGCASCGHSLEGGLSRADPTLWPRGDVSRGDRILVDKLVYRLRAPERFDVAVFKFPLRPEQSYIKRLIGLPGELVELRGGDVFVNGAIARKPRKVQEHLWRTVHDTRFPERDRGGARGPAFRSAGGSWTLEPERLRGDAGGAEAWLVYARAIRDVTPYNEPMRAGGDHVVGDARLVFEVEVEPGTPASPTDGVLARIVSGDEAVTLFYPAQGGEAELGVGDEPVARRSVPPLSPGRAQPFEICRWDARVLVALGDDVIFDRELPTRGEEVERSEVRFGLRGRVRASFLNVAIGRDIYYRNVLPKDFRETRTLPEEIRRQQFLGRLKATVDGAMTACLQSILGRRRLSVTLPYRVPPAAYLFLGDNSSNSTDGRYWGTVPASHLVGRAFVVFWPALPGDFAVRRVR